MASTRIELGVVPAKGSVEFTAPYCTEGMRESVILANAGIQKRDRTNIRIPLDSRHRGNDAI